MALYRHPFRWRIDWVVDANQHFYQRCALEIWRINQQPRLINIDRGPFTPVYDSLVNFHLAFFFYLYAVLFSPMSYWFHLIYSLPTIQLHSIYSIISVAFVVTLLFVNATEDDNCKVIDFFPKIGVIKQEAFINHVKYWLPQILYRHHWEVPRLPWTQFVAQP